jgi:hypothetical protein
LPTKVFFLIINRNATKFPLSLFTINLPLAWKLISLIAIEITWSCWTFWLVGNFFLAGYSEYDFESRGYFRKTSSIISSFSNEMFLSSGSSNQLGECIIKHRDLVPFAQRTVWIKVFCRGAKDWSWLVELYRVKLKFLKKFSMVFSWVACCIESLYMFLSFEFLLGSIVK